MKTLFIINPISGGRKRNPVYLIKRVKFIYQQLGEKFEIIIWRRPDQIDEIIQYAKDHGFTRVIAAGGDGTVLAVGSRLVGTHIAMGIIPRGSGNGYAGHLGLKKKLDWVINQNVNSTVVRVDTGIFGGNRFLNCAGVGLDGVVAEAFSHSRTRGLRTYLSIGTQKFLSYKPENYTLTIDDGEPMHLENIVVMDIMNGREWGRGAKVAPFNSITDGVMSVVFLRRTSAINIPNLMKLAFRGNIHKHKDVTTYHGKKFVIEREKAGWGHIDGDPIHLPQHLVCEVVERSLDVLVPNDMEFFV